MTTDPGAGSIRDDLRSAVTRAMKARDRAELAGYRSALAAIDNAEAVPPNASDRAGAMELAGGVGRTEVRLRLLTEGEMIDIVAGEIAERRIDAEAVADASPTTAQQLRHDAQLLQAMMDHASLRSEAGATP